MDLLNFHYLRKDKTNSPLKVYGKKRGRDHLGRVGLERGASEVDSDCQNTYVSEPPRDPPGASQGPSRSPPGTGASTSTGIQHLGCSELKFWDDSTNRSVDLNRESTPRIVIVIVIVIVVNV